MTTKQFIKDNHWRFSIPVEDLQNKGTCYWCFFAPCPGTYLFRKAFSNGGKVPNWEQITLGKYFSLAKSLKNICANEHKGGIFHE